MAAHLKIFLLVAILSSAVYFNSFQNSFHFDDRHYIVSNPYIRDVSNIPVFFFGTQFSSFEKAFTAHYRPLIVTTYALNYAAGGLNPMGYHIVNLLFHIGSAFLIFLIIKTMLTPLLVKGGWGDFFIPLSAALIFAVHPFNSEVVNYITARSSVMCSFFYLLSFYCWTRFTPTLTLPRQEGGKQGGKSLFYIFSLFFFILALLSKEIAITLPLMIVIYDLYFNRDDGFKFRISHFAFRTLKYYLPFIALVAIPYLIFRSSMLKWVVAGRSSEIYSNLLIQPKVLLKYLQLLFYPAGLTIDHIIEKPSTVYAGIFILSVIAILIILCSAYMFCRKGREWKVLSFFIVWFFITLLPTTLVPLNAVLQENRGYLAGIVFPVLAGIILWKMPQRIAIALLVIIVFIFSIQTTKSNAYWKNEFTLWKRGVEVSPSSPRSHDNLGLAYVESGDYDRAISEFEYTLGLNPLYYLAYYNEGVVYQIQKRFDLAEASYEQCLKINPDFFRCYYNLGIVYKKTGELDEAIAVYEKAVSLDPRHPFVYNNLGIVLTETGDYNKAESVFKKAIEINPGYAKAYYNLGNVYFRERRYDLAVEAFNTALRIEPGYKEASQMLAEALKRLP